MSNKPKNYPFDWIDAKITGKSSRPAKFADAMLDVEKFGASSFDKENNSDLDGGPLWFGIEYDGSGLRGSWDLHPDEEQVKEFMQKLLEENKTKNRSFGISLVAVVDGESNMHNNHWRVRDYKPEEFADEAGQDKVISDIFERLAYLEGPEDPDRIWATQEMAAKMLQMWRDNSITDAELAPAVNRKNTDSLTGKRLKTAVEKHGLDRDKAAEFMIDNGHAEWEDYED